jgi:hypothetical protein
MDERLKCNLDLPFTTRAGAGMWRIEGDPIPLQFSIRTRKL